MEGEKERPASAEDGPLYRVRVRATGAAQPISHAIFGRVWEPELMPLPPVPVATNLATGELRVRALDQLVLSLAG